MKYYYNTDFPKGPNETFSRIIKLFIYALLMLLYTMSCLIAEPLGHIDTIGNTWAENQWGSYNVGNMLALDTLDNSIYVSWTYKPPPPGPPFYWYKSYFNCYHPSTGWIYPEPGYDMFPDARNSHSHEIAIWETNQNTGKYEIVYNCISCLPFNSQRAWWQNDHFETAPIDTSTFQVSQLRSASNRNGSISIVGNSGSNYLYYTNYIPEPYVTTNWEFIDTLTFDIYGITASFVSEKVAIAYLRQRQFNGHDFLVYDQNVYYISSSDGRNPDVMSKVNITHFSSNDVFRPQSDVDIILDQNDLAHIAFRGQEVKLDSLYPESTLVDQFMSYIWVWNEDEDSFSVAADGWIPDPGYIQFGVWQYPVDRPKLAINHNNGYIYLLYEKNSIADIALSGFPNTDLWITVSTDNGLNWSEGINVTSTYAPGCDNDLCMCEIQASLARIVNDTLHLSYILDKNAGNYWQQEGDLSESKVIYQKIPANLISTTPLITQFSIREGPPRCHYLPGDLNGDSTTVGTDVTYAVNYFKGFGSPPTIDCNCPEIVQPFFAAGDVNGNCTFNGIDITFFVAYLKGRRMRLFYCPSCPPERI